MEKKTLIGIFFAGLIFSITGSLVAVYSLQVTENNAKAIKSWPEIKGVITSSRVITHRDKEGPMYSADVVYEYSVNNRKYNSSTIRSEGDYKSDNSSKVYEVIKRYPKGIEVKVYYNPKKPEVAVLEPGDFFISSYSKILWLVGALFLYVGSLVMIGASIIVLFLLLRLFFAGCEVIKKRFIRLMHTWTH